MTTVRNTVSFADLEAANLRVDAIYEGGSRGNAGDDPSSKLLSVSNMGGFRYLGSLSAIKLLVLTSTLTDPDWPDSLDTEAGVFTYYGDNKHPGRELHKTPRHGNEILRQVFELAQGGRVGRCQVPPILVFCGTGKGRDVQFLGLAAPGTLSLRPAEDLVAIWKAAGGRRFQNYRARFTVLDVSTVSRAWLNDIIAGSPHSATSPLAWRSWVETGELSPLVATRSLEYRRKAEQIPEDHEGLAVIDAIHGHFAARPHDFEYCAAAIARVMLPDIAGIDVTRPSRDGGRDATGQLRIGVGPGAILVDFALEAKCFQMNSSVGVREVSRLISRLRHRQFGILVTTSHLDRQAYKEIKEDHRKLPRQVDT